MIFLDVGAHDGQTLEEVLQPGYPFTVIHAFEPMPAQFATLMGRFSDPRLHVHNFGLLDRTENLPLYGTNEAMEASVYPAKADVDATVVTPASFMDASAFFRRYVTGPVVVKLNCEGSEVAIVDSLIASGEIWKVTFMMLDFDVRKIPGMEHQEADLLARLATIGFGGARLALCEDVMQGATHQLRIANWLRTIGITR